MADISFYSDTKKVPNYNSILNKISEKYKKDFKYDENFLSNKDQLLGKLYEFRGKLTSSSDSINIDIFISKDFIDKDYLNRDINYSRYIKDIENSNLFGRLNIIEEERKLFEYIVRIYRIHKIILSEINSYIYNRRVPIGLHNIIVDYDNKIINEIISFIDNSEILRYFILDMDSYRKKDILDKVGVEGLINEILNIKKIINNKYHLLDSDFNLKFDIKLDIILKFLIIKFEEIDIQVDTTKIEYLFEELSIQSNKEANNSIKYLIGIILGTVLFNIILIPYNYYHPFDYYKISQYIPMILLEIILFKFMFFFFDKYNTYSKISSIYDYYKGLVQADNIYTTDKKFTQEQNFILREKTYLELTNLSTHLKGIIDKQQNNSKEVIDILKEINNISPIFKNLNK